MLKNLLCFLSIIPFSLAVTSCGSDDENGNGGDNGNGNGTQTPAPRPGLNATEQGWRGLEFEVNYGEASIIGFYDGELTLPNQLLEAGGHENRFTFPTTFNNYPITEIRENAFSLVNSTESDRNTQFNAIESIFLDFTYMHHLEVIEKNAFREFGLFNIVDLRGLENLLIIKDYAFYNRFDGPNIGNNRGFGVFLDGATSLEIIGVRAFARSQIITVGSTELRSLVTIDTEAFANNALITQGFVNPEGIFNIRTNLVDGAPIFSSRFAFNFSHLTSLETIGDRAFASNRRSVGASFTNNQTFRYLNYLINLVEIGEGAFEEIGHWMLIDISDLDYLTKIRARAFAGGLQSMGNTNRGLRLFGLPLLYYIGDSAFYTINSGLNAFIEIRNVPSLNASNIGSNAFPNRNFPNNIMDQINASIDGIDIFTGPQIG